MSRKNFVIFILLLITVLGGLLWFFFLRTDNTTPNITDIKDPNFFPFPDGAPDNKPATTTVSTTTPIIDLGGGITILPNLRQLWKEPTAGAGFIASSSKTQGIRFVDRSTGHIYESPIEDTGEAKISNITIPQIHEVYFSKNASNVLMRYLKDEVNIQSFYGVISTSTETTTTSSPALEGYFLQTNIKEIASTIGKLLYFDPTTSNNVLVESNFDGTGKKFIMTSDTSQWLISRNGSKTAFLSTKPSGTVGGFGYTLDIATGVFRNVVSDVLGLTGTINPSGQYVFMSGVLGSGIDSGVFDIKNGITKALSKKTLSDKCSWGNTEDDIIYCAVPNYVSDGVYPDDWYQGNTGFDDIMWKINVATGETEFVFDPQMDVFKSMDMFKISLDSTDSYLVFTNKKDMSLWLYRLNY